MEVLGKVKFLGLFACFRAVFTGGAPYSGDLALACGAYTVDMVDAYGDGWNGNTLSIGMDSFTIDYGASASGSRMNGSMVSVSCDGGSWQSEVSWTITSADGSTIWMSSFCR